MNHRRWIFKFNSKVLYTRLNPENVFLPDYRGFPVPQVIPHDYSNCLYSTGLNMNNDFNLFIYPHSYMANKEVEEKVLWKFDSLEIMLDCIYFILAYFYIFSRTYNYSRNEIRIYIFKNYFLVYLYIYIIFIGKSEWNKTLALLLLLFYFFFFLLLEIFLSLETLSKK